MAMSCGARQLQHAGQRCYGAAQATQPCMLLPATACTTAPGRRALRRTQLVTRGAPRPTCASLRPQHSSAPQTAASQQQQALPDAGQQQDMVVQLRDVLAAGSEPSLPSGGSTPHAASSLSLSASALALGLLAAAASLATGEGAAWAGDLSGPAHHPVAADLGRLAAGEDFWANVVQYMRFFVTVMLGSVIVITKPFVALLKRPVTAVLLVAGLVSLVLFLNFSLNAMLGITDPVQYEPGSMVIR